MASTQVPGRTDSDECVMEGVLSAVAAREGCDPLDLPPLYETVDPDALAGVVESDGFRRLAFDYAGHRVVVTGDGDVAVDRGAD